MTTAEFFEHELVEWKKDIEFYKGELSFFFKMLTEVAGKNTGMTISQNIEHYQNQFIIQKEHLDTFQHRIADQLHEIRIDLEKKNKLTSLKVKERQQEIRAEMHTAEKIIIDLKQEYYKFLSRVC